MLDEALGLPSFEQAAWLDSQAGERAAHAQALDRASEPYRRRLRVTATTLTCFSHRDDATAAVN